MSKGKLFISFILITFGALYIFGFTSVLNVIVDGNYQLEEQNIIEKNGEHYLLLDGYELSLSRDFYMKIELDKTNEYKIKYAYNRLNNKNGEIVMLKKYGEQPWGK
ncbi:hypothetical protein [Solibacillus isronensis]|uniref:hypothetical protein n=1 Tax=Solibacillus isronensis TaxID=412383 RepID=UPI00203E0A78|nr:hypothetical protein [Solibacillus isronensis]MCM3721075.1 hypothetical protein [Solibacillus isronensis]